jgi:hypothetical protein
MTHERRGLLIRLGRLAGIVPLAGVAHPTASGSEGERKGLLAEAVVGSDWDLERPSDCVLSWTCNVYCGCYNGNYSAVPAPPPTGG